MQAKNSELQNFAGNKEDQAPRHHYWEAACDMKVDDAAFHVEMNLAVVIPCADTRSDDDKGKSTQELLANLGVHICGNAEEEQILEVVMNLDDEEISPREPTMVGEIVEATVVEAYAANGKPLADNDPRFTKMQRTANSLKGKRIFNGEGLKSKETLNKYFA
jgi:hypothetical protein